MMISAQSIYVNPSRIPQLAGISRTNSPVSLSLSTRNEALIKRSSGSRTGRGGARTLATERASSFSSGAAAGVSDDRVPAKETGVHDSTAGTQNVELMDPILEARRASPVDDQLPSLLTMFIDGFPPLQPSKYIPEAEERLQQYIQRYPNADSLGSYCRLGLCSAICLHPAVISVDRLVAIGIIYGLLFLIDDFLFDTPNASFDKQYGVSCDARESPQTIQKYFDHLDAIFSQQVQPSNPAPLMETLMWESGREMLELSNPEWFMSFVAGVKDCHYSSVTTHADIIQGHTLSFQDLESYTHMRKDNVGATFVQLMIEFANNSYIPHTLKETPYYKNVFESTSIYIGFINDVFSYHKESSLEENPRNLITMLMKCEGKPFVQAVHRAIGLVNSNARIVMDLEATTWNPILQRHLHDIKVVLAGNLYFNFSMKRYRHPNSIFLELRDTTSSWKTLLDAKGFIF